MAAVTFMVNRHRPDAFTLTLTGRDAWTLQQLIDAGASGCTPIERPAPRWSSYVHRLRGMGAAIETIMEPHGGAYPGIHARYVLACTVERMQGNG